MIALFRFQCRDSGYPEEIFGSKGSIGKKKEREGRGWVEACRERKKEEEGSSRDCRSWEDQEGRRFESSREEEGSEGFRLR